MLRFDVITPRWIDDPFATLQSAKPRLLIDTAARERIAAAHTDREGARLWATLVSRGTAILAEPAITVITGLNDVRCSLDRIYTVGLLAQITGERWWSERAIAEAEGLAECPTWGGATDWLIRAEAMHAVAIALDWCAPWLGHRQAVLLDALITKGLDAADTAYACRAWWWRDTANWNGVCNSAVLIACLVAADVRPEQCRRLAAYALQGLPHHICRLAPDGAHEEGPGYWAYTWRYLSVLCGCLQTALGHDFGLSDLPGLAGTALFRLHHHAPGGQFFAWGDSYREAPFDPNLLWLARRYDQPAVAAFARRQLAQAAASTQYGALARALIDWTAAGDDAMIAALPLQARFVGPAVICARTSWDAHATWVGLKGGDVQAPHAHRDLGAVVIEAAGVRWIDDPGAGDYGAPGYWNGRPDSDGARWQIFHCAAEGHSTLLIDGVGVDLLAQMHLTAEAALAVTSSSAFLDRGVKTWTRAIAAISSGAVTITDELDCTRPVTVTVQWITSQSATVDGNAVRLNAPSENMSALLECSVATAPTVITAIDSGPWTRIAWTMLIPAGSHRMVSQLRMDS